MSDIDDWLESRFEEQYELENDVEFGFQDRFDVDDVEDEDDADE